MKPIYVLDACAMLTVLSHEQGCENVVALYRRAYLGEITLAMNKVNLLEVYYDIFRSYGSVRADEFIANVKQSPIIVNDIFSDDIFHEAGRLKASYKISLGDSFALAQAIILGGALVTSDHHEFDVIEGKENISFEWIR